MGLENSTSLYETSHVLHGTQTLRSKNPSWVEQFLFLLLFSHIGVLLKSLTLDTFAEEILGCGALFFFSSREKDTFTIEPVFLWPKRCIDACIRQPQLNLLLFSFWLPVRTC